MSQYYHRDLVAWFISQGRASPAGHRGESIRECIRTTWRFKVFNRLEILFRTFRTLSNEKDCSTTVRKITKIRKAVEKEEMKVWKGPRRRMRH